MKRMMRLLSLALCLMLVQQTAFAAIPEDYVTATANQKKSRSRWMTAGTWMLCIKSTN